jgi:glycosyltransferase involved in cell wall biosynthesis
MSYKKFEKRNIVLFSYGNNGSGGYNAAHRIFLAVKDFVNVKFFVVENFYLDETKISIPNFFQKKFNSLKKLIVIVFKKISFTNKYNPYSLSIFPSSYSNLINKNNQIDLVHLNWVNFEMISIFDIARIQKPILWTVHDLWPISGIFHLENKRVDSSLLRKLDSFVFDLKKSVFRNKKFYFVAPSNWILKKIQENTLFENFSVSVIPNPIDVNFWKKLSAKKNDNNKFVIGFGAYNFLNDFNKGFDIFLDSLKILSAYHNSDLFVIYTFGDKLTNEISDLGFESVNFGAKLNDLEMLDFFNSIDVFVMPSRSESFGQVAVESMACGCPVIGFDNSGLYDIVKHKKTGYLAKAFSIGKLVCGINYFFSNPELAGAVSDSCIEHVNNNFSFEVIGHKYLNLYNEILLNEGNKYD